MADKSIFISYPRRHRDDVEDLIRYLEDAQLSVWYDRNIRMGDFRDWITEAIKSAKAMIVILTEESVGPKSSGWIENEIDIARDNGLKNMILPCYIGDFVPPQKLAEKITFLQSISAPTISDLRSHDEFRDHVRYLRDLVAGKVSGLHPSFEPQANNTTDLWFSKTPAPTTSEIALALSTMLLEYQPADMVVETAREIEHCIEARLGEKTEEERAKETRALSMVTATQRFEKIGAERVTLPDPNGAAQPSVLRFKNRNWRGAMLRHVWDEMDDVRDVLFDWMTRRLSEWRQDTVDDAIIRTLGSFAQRDLQSLRHRLLDDWLVPQNDLRPVFAASEIIASAAEQEANLPLIRKLLMPLANPAHGDKDLRRHYRTLAVLIALGPLALRRPDISVDVMKVIGRELFVDPVLFRAATRSAAIYGQKKSADGKGLDGLELEKKTDNDKEQTDPVLATETGGDTTHENDPATNAQDTAELAKLSQEDRTPPASKAVPAALFLAQIADWADEDAPTVAATLERQVPLKTLLYAFYGMPLLNREGSTRLTLEDLTGDIASQDKTVIDRIVKGFVRAGMAQKRLNYLPRRDMQLVFKGFAQERAHHLGAGIKMPVPDPYLAFAGVVHTALAAKSKDYAALIIDGSDRWVTDNDKAIIRSGGPLIDQLKRTQDAID